MNFIPIKVECHSGYKVDEYPISFYWKNIRFEIKEVSDRWYQADPSPGSPEADYFKVATICDAKYIIKHDLKSDRWFLVSADDPIVIPFSSD